MYQNIILLFFLSLFAIFFMLFAIVFIDFGTPDDIVDEINMGHLKREQHRTPLRLTVDNKTLDEYGKGFSCDRPSVDALMRLGIDNIKPAAFPRKSFFELDLASNCTKNKLIPRKAVGIEILRDPGFYVLDLTLEPIQVVVESSTKSLEPELPHGSPVYWYLYQSPVNPFDCTFCGAQVSIEYNEGTLVKHHIEAIGIMEDNFPLIIDITKPETIRRQFKKHFITSIRTIDSKNTTHVLQTDFSFFAHRRFYLLLGFVPLSKNRTNIGPWSTNPTTSQSLQNLKFHALPKLHYSLCVSNYSSTFRLQVQCFAVPFLHTDDKGFLRYANGDCVCWKRTTIKQIFLFDLFLVSFGILLLVLLKRKNRLRLRTVDMTHNNEEIDNCTHIYNVFIRVALPPSKDRIPGSLYVKFLEEDENNITSILINSRHRFSKTFLGSNEVSELKVILRSKEHLKMPRKVRVTFADVEDKCNTLYLFGVIFSDKNKRHVSLFPYNHYLGDQRQARLCEASIWRDRLNSQSRRMKLPTRPPPTSTTLMEQTFYVISAFEVIPRQVMASINLDESYITVLASCVFFGLFAYFVNYTLFTFYIKPLVFEERYFFVQSIPGLAEKLQLILGVFWIFLLLMYIASFIEAAMFSVWVSPLTYSKAKRFQETVITKDITWVVLVCIATVVQFAIIALVVLAIKKYRKQEKIELGPIASLDEEVERMPSQNSIE